MKILNLAPSRSGSPLKMQVKANEAEIVLYAGIGQDWWGDGSMVSAKNFSDELKKLPENTNTLSIRLNSPGGDVFEGIAIYNRILDWKRKSSGRSVNVFIDGWAASIASIIALAGDEIKMGEGALYMIHLPWTFAWGNRMDLENVSNRLSDIEEQMLNIYSKKSGMAKAEIRALLEDETWMDADEAIDKGFVHSKQEDTAPIAASAAKSKWIRRAPENYLSQAKATNTRIQELKNKVSARLARK